MVSTLKSTTGYALASLFQKGGAHLPTVVFLPGFRSDMMGTKAVYLAERCAARSQSFLRFDYSGHGQSEGAFQDGCISEWLEDALFMIDQTSGPLVLVGSSMGGWIGLLCAYKRPDRVRAFIGIAAAPNFTDWIEADLTPAQKQELNKKGFVSEQSEYSPEPQIYTRRLLEDGARNRLPLTGWRDDLQVVLLQGLEDADVPWRTVESIQKLLPQADIKLIQGGDHRLSRPEDLALLDDAVVRLSHLI